MTRPISGLAILAALIAGGILYGAGDGRPPIVGVAHVVLRTNDLAAAQKFYGDILGFEHFEAPKPEAGSSVRFFKINDHQYIEILPNLESEDQDRLVHIAFETRDARQLRQYLANHNAKVPETLERDSEGNLSFRLKDPEDHEIEFVEYVRGSVQMKHFGKLLPDSRVAKRMIHAGQIIHNRAAADAFYRDVLGFQVMWYGGKTEDRVDYVDMRVPEGSDWLEYMLNVTNPTPKTRGVMNHLALGVPDIHVPAKIVADRGYSAPQPPKIGVDGKWQLNMYDPNLTRTELMEFRPVQKPCCSPMLLPSKIVTE
jgi:catechol 2,3-dioxygenase-like lactoylglutathione lyase family enzyme